MISRPQTPVCGQNAFLIGLLALIAGTTSLAVTAAHAGNGSKLVFLKLQADAGIGALTQTAAEDAVETQLDQAAPDRGWELVSLGRIMGLEDKARACADATCRQAIAKKLQATHVLYGRVRKSGWKTLVDLILEDDAGKILRAKTIEGRALSLGEKVRVGVDQLLEETSPKEATARARLVQTADSYAKAGRIRDEVRTLQRAIQLNPFQAEAPGLQARIVNVWAHAGEFKEAKDEAARFVDMYGPLSAWGKTASDVDRAAAQSAGSRAFIVMGTEAHRRARALEAAGRENGTPVDGEQVKTLQDIAATSYLAVRRNWPSAKETSELTIYLADLRFDQHAYAEAADLYREVQSLSAHQVAATVGLVFIQERVLARQHPALAPTADIPKVLPHAPEPLPPAATRYVDAVDELVRLAPNAPSRFAQEVAAGKLLLTLGHIDEGKKRLQAVVERAPRSSAGEVAAKLLAGLKRVRVPTKASAPDK